ncbi:MAG: putative glycoside hydrolase [Thermoleophilia bacterium]
MSTTRRPERPARAREREQAPRSRRRRPWLTRGLMALAALGFGLLSGYALRDAGLQVGTVGPPQNAHLGPAATDALVFRISADLPSLMDTATLDYDGADVMEDAHVSDGVLTYRPRDLDDGRHELSFSISQPFVPWRVTRTWHFTVDRVRPEIEITGPARPAVRDAPVTLTGRVNEPATVTIGSQAVPVAADGTFSHTFREAPSRSVIVRATDLAGNARGVRTAISVAPRTPIMPTRAVHMTAISWATDSLREPVLDMLRTGEINTIELDLKDESGIVGFNSTNALARRIGAVRPEYDLAEATREIHELGGRVIGRLVAFRDPVLARYAWDHRNRNQVIQTPDGQPYAGYGGFTNFANPVVRAYNIDIAVEAAKGGVDDILYDYVRRPDGPLETMRFPTLKGSAQASIVSFLVQARAELDPTGAFLGASLFGIAAFDPKSVSQDVRRIARTVDYVAPLIYPSHWGAGAFGVPDPESEPGPIINDSIEKFEELMQGSGARIVPWLQDFSLRVPYGEKEVCAQVEAAAARGVDEWIMWDPNVTYTRADCLRGG